MFFVKNRKKNTAFLYKKFVICLLFRFRFTNILVSKSFLERRKNMKKLLVLAAVAVLAAGAAQAKIDLVSAAQQAQSKIDSVTQANEDAKANLEAKKKELEAKQEAKKKELAEKQAAQKAEREAKAAEQKKALEDTKNSLNSLKNSFTK